MHFRGGVAPLTSLIIDMDYVSHRHILIGQHHPLEPHCTSPTPVLSLPYSGTFRGRNELQRWGNVNPILGVAHQPSMSHCSQGYVHILHYIVLHLCVHITHGLDHRVGGLDPPPLPIGCNPWRLSLYDMWQIGLPFHLYIESMVRGVFIPSSPSWNPLLCLCFELLECLSPS